MPMKLYVTTMTAGWDDRCYPYGGDGKASIGAILRGEVKL